MYTIYDGAHSIVFGGKHSWKDFFLIPASRPHVEPPPVKTNTLEVPGMNGVVNLTNVPLGFPVYNMRSGSWTFYIDHDSSGQDWEITYSILLEALHGRTMQVILDDDRSYYYEGELAVSDPSPQQHWTDVTVEYSFQPFKRMIWTTTEDWLWDPFDFRYGDIPQTTFKDIPVDSDSYTGLRTWTQAQIGAMPVTPTFTVNSTDGNGINVAIHNVNLGKVKYFSFPDGETTNPQIMLACPTLSDKTRLLFKGHGTISIDFRPGRL